MKMNNCIQLAAATKPPNPFHTVPSDMLTVKLNECVCKDVADVLETGSVGARDVDVGGMEILICAARACAGSRKLCAGLHLTASRTIEGSLL